MEADNRLPQIVGLIIGLFLHTIFVMGMSHAGQMFFIDIVGMDYDRAVVFIVLSVTIAIFDLKIVMKNT